MATLMYEHAGVRRAGAITGRIMIGRWPINTIALDDPSLSRVHAWIARDASEDRYYLADSASRAGTFVNGQRIAIRQVLRSGDEIRVGSVRLWISPGLSIPPDAEPVDLTPKPLAGIEMGGGVFHECACGAPLWIPLNAVGRAGRCRYCSRSVTLRGTAATASATTPATATRAPSRAVAKPPASIEVAPDVERATCVVCQSPVELGEPTMRCPECGLVYHRECWIENRGCATYGCPQVGALEQVAGEGE